MLKAFNRNARRNLSQRAAIDAILKERDYQLSRFSAETDTTKTPEEWITILQIFLGKAAMETAQYREGNFSLAGFRKRVTQVTAIGMAILETMERKTEGTDEG